MKNYGRGLHSQVKQKAQSQQGLRLSDLKPNSREVAERLIKQGAIYSVGGKLVWHGD